MKTRISNLITKYLIAMCALALCAGMTLPASAQSHPDYHQAIINLRNAKARLASNLPDQNLAQAAREVGDEIDHAINDLKFASKMNDTDANVNVPLISDAGVSPSQRLHAAIDYLNKAYADASSKETDPAAMRSQAAALQRIDRSRHVLKHALREE